MCVCLIFNISLMIREKDTSSKKDTVVAFNETSMVMLWRRAAFCRLLFLRAKTTDSLPVLAPVSISSEQLHNTQTGHRSGRRANVSADPLLDARKQEKKRERIVSRLRSVHPSFNTHSQYLAAAVSETIDSLPSAACPFHSFTSTRLRQD